MAGFELIVEPDEEDADAARVLVDGTVGGRPYRFLLDTGTARTCVRLDAHTAGFARVGSSDSSGLFGRGTDDLVTAPSIELGPIARTNFPVARVARADPAVANLIGMDLLGDHRCHVRFDEHRVVVDPPEEPGGGATRALFLDRVGHPYVDVRFGDIAAAAVWDSGAGITIADLTFVRRHPALFRETGRSRGTDATGATMETPMLSMAAATIGDRAFPPHTVAGVDLSGVNATIDAPMDLILGYSTLAKANWWFDFPGRRWGVTAVLERV